MYTIHYSYTIQWVTIFFFSWNCCKWQIFIPFYLSSTALYVGGVCVCVCVCVCLNLLHLSVNGHLSCFHILAIINNATTKTGVKVAFQISVSFFLPKYIPRNGTVGLYGSSIFSFSRNCHTVFHSCGTNSHSHSVQGFLFLHILVIICHLCSFWWQSSFCSTF